MCVHVWVHVAPDYSHLVSHVDQVVSLSFYTSNHLPNIELGQREQVIPRSSIVKLTFYQQVLNDPELL